MSVPTIKLPSIVVPKIVFETPKPRKRKIYVIVFFAKWCPVCKRYIDPETVSLREGTGLYKAVQTVKSDPEVELILRLVDIDTPDGELEADELGIQYIPTVFINGEQIPNKFLDDPNILVEIMYGREPPPQTLRRYEQPATYIGRALRRWLKPW